MAPIRILVVDDSAVIRKVLSDTLAEDRALEVVGTASDGRIALAKIPLLKPDLITLDVEMPVMDGLETLAAIRKFYPNCRDHVQHAHRARGGGDPRCAGAGSVRLCHQTEQHRQSRGCHRAHSHRTDPQDQGVVRDRSAGSPALAPASSGT